MVKISVSLEDDLVKRIRERAAETRKPTSRYIADLIVEDLHRHQDEIAEEGYKLLSADTRSFADSAWKIAGESWSNWGQAPEGTLDKAKAG